MSNFLKKRYNASFSSKVQDPSARIGTCISAKTIQLFHAETACFLSEVLQFVIGLHETRQLLIDESEDEAENNSNQPKTRRSFVSCSLHQLCLLVLMIVWLTTDKWENRKAGAGLDGFEKK